MKKMLSLLATIVIWFILPVSVSFANDMTSVYVVFDDERSLRQLEVVKNRFPTIQVSQPFSSLARLSSFPFDRTYRIDHVPTSVVERLSKRSGFYIEPVPILAMPSHESFTIHDRGIGSLTTLLSGGSNTIPNDPLFFQQEIYDGLSFNDGNLVCADYPLPSVAIIANGFFDHEDLEFAQTRDVTEDTTDVTPSSINPRHTQGTSMASIIAATTNNNIGMASLVHVTDLIGIKAVSDESFVSSSIPSNTCEGAVKAFDLGAGVITTIFASTTFSTVCEAVYATIIDEGVTVIASAGFGPTSNEIYYPAGYDGVMSVASVDSNGTIISTYGPSVSITAPVNHIVAAYESGYQLSSSIVAAPAIVTAAHAVGIDVIEHAHPMSDNPLYDQGYLGAGMLAFPDECKEQDVDCVLDATMFDFNQDGHINYSDLHQVASIVQGGIYEECPDGTLCDVDGNGQIQRDDVRLLSSLIREIMINDERDQEQRVKDLLCVLVP